MKGLIYKEWTILSKSYKQMVFFLAVLYGGIALATGMTSMAFALPIVFAIMITSTIAFDENSRWDTYARTLPVTPAQIVGCKYLCGLGGLAFGTVCTAAVAALSNLVPPLLVEHDVTPPTALDVAAGLLVCSAMSLLFVALLLPLSYKFNSTKARSWLFLIVGVLAGCVGLLIGLSDKASAFFTAPDEVILPLLAVFFVVMLAVYGVSYKVCVGIYRQKEY